MASEEPSAVRLLFADAEENRREVVWDAHTESVSANSKAFPVGANADALPYMASSPLWADENSKVVLEAKSDAADTVESEESAGSFPVLLRNKKTGVIYKKNLRVGDANGDFTGFAATADVALVTTRFTRLGSYTVPAGFQLTLDPTRKVHLYLGDDT